VEAVNHRLIRDDEKRQRDGCSNDARHHALDHEWPTHEPFRGTDQLHHLDFLPAVIDSGPDCVHDDHDGDDDKNRHQADSSQAEPRRQLEHPVDEVTLVVGGVARVDARPPSAHQVDGRYVLQVANSHLELGVERIAADLGGKHRVVRVRLELRQSLLFGDERDGGNPRVGLQLHLEVADCRQRGSVGDVDRDLADLQPETVDDLRERVPDEQVHAGENEDERDRQHRGQADREVAPEALPGAIERESEVS